MFNALLCINFVMELGMNCHGIRVRVRMHLKISQNKKISHHVNKDAKT
jgi:hypothetical protein